METLTFLSNYSCSTSGVSAFSSCISFDRRRFSVCSPHAFYWWPVLSLWRNFFTKWFVRKNVRGEVASCLTNVLNVERWVGRCLLHRHTSIESLSLAVSLGSHPSHVLFPLLHAAARSTLQLVCSHFWPFEPQSIFWETFSRGFKSGA